MAEIGFPVQACGEFPHQYGQIERAQARKELLPDLYQVEHRRDIGGDHLFEAGALHLYRHATPGVQRSLVYLGDGGRGQRCFAEGCEELRHRLAEFPLDGAAYRSYGA